LLNLRLLVNSVFCPEIKRGCGSMTEQADFVVVGLGAMGSAVLYQLAKRGADVIGVDRFAPPHQMGSSHGETRITRQAVGEGGAYAPLVLSSHRIWRELEGDTGERLLSDCGVLVMGPGTGSTSHHGKPDFVARSIEVARGFGIVHEVLDGAEVGRRFPQFLGLAGNEKAYYEPDGGYVFPERCIKAQLMRAAQLGAQVRTGLEVRSISQHGSVRIETSDGTIEAGQVVMKVWPRLACPCSKACVGGVGGEEIFVVRHDRTPRLTRSEHAAHRIGLGSHVGFQAVADTTVPWDSTRSVANDPLQTSAPRCHAKAHGLTPASSNHNQGEKE